jgi:hypothetical protein
MKTRNNRMVLMEKHDVKYLWISYLTALKKYWQGCPIVYAYETYTVAIPNLKIGVMVVHWVCLHLYQEKSSSTCSIWRLHWFRSKCLAYLQT